MTKIDMNSFLKIILARMKIYVDENYGKKLTRLSEEKEAVEKMIALLNQCPLPKNFPEKMTEHERKLTKLSDMEKIARIKSGGNSWAGHIIEGNETEAVLIDILARNAKERQTLEVKKTQLENDFIGAIHVSGKFIKPLTSISEFFKFLRLSCGCDDFIIGRAIGLAIKYNVEYNQNHPDEEMADIEILRQLARYINPFGSRIAMAEEDENNFESLLRNLLFGSESLEDKLEEDKPTAPSSNTWVSRISAAMTSNAYYDHIYVVPEKGTSPATVASPQKDLPESEPLTSGEVAFRALLNDIYKKGEVIGLPNCVLVDFFKMATQYLETKEAEYIIGNIKSKLISPILMYITPADREVVIGANAAKNHLTKEQASSYDSLIGDLNTLATIAKEGIGEGDKEDFDDMLSTALGNLRLLFENQGIILGESVSKHRPKQRKHKRNQQPQNIS